MLPVILVHGFASSSEDLRFLASFLRGKGLLVHCLRYAEASTCSTAVVPMRKQMEALNEQVREVVRSNGKSFEDGYNVVAHSQGAVIMRGAIIEYGLATHCRIHHFVSLAGPHLGLRLLTDEMIRITSGMCHEAHADLVRELLGRCAQEVAKGDACMPIRLRKGVLSNFAPVFLYRPLREQVTETDFLWAHNEGVADGAEADIMAVSEYHFLAGANDGVVDPASAQFEKPSHGLHPTWALVENAGRIHRTVIPGIGHADWLSPEHANVWREHILDILLADTSPQPSPAFVSRAALIKDPSYVERRARSISTTTEGSMQWTSGSEDDNEAESPVARDCD